MKDRFITILRVSVVVQLIFVWVPTFLVGTLILGSFSEWTYALGTASSYYQADPYALDLSDFCLGIEPCEHNSSRYFAGGVMTWGAVMGITLGLLYFLSGSLRLRNRSEPKTRSEAKSDAESQGLM